MIKWKVNQEGWNWGAKMRVIAGVWKGLRLEAPVGMEARPTTDRVKESMFSLMGVDWAGAGVVDLFAGSGALGIEALSRGADSAVFVDKNQKSMAAVRTNLTRCGALRQAHLIVGNWKMGWQKAAQFLGEIGWVFVDPPYPLMLWEEVLQEIARAQKMIQFGIVCEHPKTVVLPESVASLVRWKHRTYGDIALTLYKDVRREGSGEKS